MIKKRQRQSSKITITITIKEFLDNQENFPNKHLP